MRVDRLSIEERIKIIKLYYTNDSSATAVLKKLQLDANMSKIPSERCVRKTVEKFEETGSVLDRIPINRSRSVRSQRNIQAVRESLLANPEMSIPRRSQLLGLSYGSLWRILHKDLKLSITATAIHSDKQLTTTTATSKTKTKTNSKEAKRKKFMRQDDGDDGDENSASNGNWDHLDDSSSRDIKLFS